MTDLANFLSALNDKLWHILELTNSLFSKKLTVT